MSPTSSSAANQAFAELGLGPELLRTLASLGYEEPTPIQRQAIPHLLEGRDLMGLAATGTGKTAAFALPLLQMIETGAKVPSALILVPTRELAVQVAQAVHRYGKELGVEVLPIYGGQAFQQQLKVLKRGVDVVVATPGRALDHIRRGTLRLGSLKVLVLDEADEMLDMGFAEDLEAILAEVPAERQTLLFSATFGPRIEAIASKQLNDPVEVRIRAEEEGEIPLVRQTAYLVGRAHKLAALGRVLDLESPEAALVFCRTRNEVDELVEALNGRGYRAEALHGGMSQEERDRVMKKLRGNKADLLVATDVAARGLDIAHLTHVVNYEVPSAPKQYVHRIGRVGRAGREGVAITLAEPRAHMQLKNIERLTKQKITVASLPTVADLQTRRLELTRASVRESIMEGGIERFRVVAEALSDEFDLYDIALGAIKMGHEATVTGSEDDDEEIPIVKPFREKSRGESKPAKGKKARPRMGSGTHLFIGAGRSAGIRPKDIVGAITGEAGVKSHDIGAIQISERFTLVEVTNDVADRVLKALKGGMIRGNKVTVRLDKGRGSGAARSALVLFLALLAGGCGGAGNGDNEGGSPGAASSATGGGPAAAHLTEAAQAEITVEAMDEELDSIVQYDRLSGSPGEIASVDYLVRTLQAEGIQVQVDTFLAYISDPVSATVEVPGTGFAPEAITVSGSGDVRNLQAPLVDMGTLRDLPPYLTETGERLVLDAAGPPGSSTPDPLPDLTGRIALVTGQPRGDPVIQLQAMGAAGIVFVNPEERLNDLTVTTVWGTPSLRDYHRIPNLPVAQVKRSDGDRLRAMLAEGSVELRMSTETLTGWKPLHLAVATIPGPTPYAPYVLAGGHLDAWYHGGTDNAGANVAMLEMARAFSRHQDELLRGLVVAWWPGHSNGRYAGSTWFVDQRFDELRRRAVAYVNFEGIGQIDAARFSASASSSLAGLAQTVLHEEVGEEGARTSAPGRNSDQSFNGVGLPLLQINHARTSEDGGYWWWHTPDDTRDKVDAQVLKVDADLYASALARLLAEPVLPVSLSAPVERLGGLLADRQETAGDHFDLSKAVTRQEELLRVVRDVEAALATGVGRGAGTTTGSASETRLDLALIAVLRPIHRILYTNQGPYHPDPAVSMGSLPGLNALEMLASNDPSTDRYLFALTTVQREGARILEALDEAQVRARELLEGLGGG